MLADRARSSIRRIGDHFANGSGTRGRAGSALADRLTAALTELGRLAHGRGVALLFDEAHTVYDSPRRGDMPLGALLSASAAAQDNDEERCR